MEIQTEGVAFLSCYLRRDENFLSTISDFQLFPRVGSKVTLECYGGQHAPLALLSKAPQQALSRFLKKRRELHTVWRWLLQLSQLRPLHSSHFRNGTQIVQATET